eukprot:Platyproteum_vivax@DN14543_c0_g1_i1.p1
MRAIQTGSRLAVNSSRNLAVACQIRNKMSGTCKWFDSTKGFGFIIPGDGSQEIFVHQMQIRSDGFRSLAEGEAVEFEIEKDEQGRRKAIEVTGPNGAKVRGETNTGPKAGMGGKTLSGDL